MNKVDIGKNIRKYRKLRGITQESLAESSGLSVKYISMLESKKFQNISINRLERIADSLDVSIDTLVSAKNDNHERPYTKLLIDKLKGMPEQQAELISKNTIDTIHLYIDIFKKN